MQWAEHGPTACLTAALLLLSFTLYDGYCLPLTNGHRSTPLLHMSIDQSTHRALGQVWSLTTLLILESHLMLEIHTGKRSFHKT